MMKELNLYDMHHHYNPLSVSGNKEKSQNPDIQESLDMMAQCGVRKSIFSYPVWFPELTEPGKRDMCRRVNEEYAGLSAVYPSLEAFALLPYSNERYHVLHEMEYALDVLHLKGILLPSNFLEICPDKDVLSELCHELDQRKAFVFVHPAFPSSKKEYMGGNIHVTMKGITRAACELVFNRVVDRYPRIRFILSCGGGNISFFFHRIKSRTLYPDLTKGFEEHELSGFEVLFKHFYYDTAFSVQTGLLNCLKAFVPESHMLYGSNFPSLPVQSVEQNLEYLRYVHCENGQTLLECLQANSSLFENGNKIMNGKEKQPISSNL